VVKKVEVPLTRYLAKTISTLDRCGLLLVSGDAKKANVMTIGWGLPGRLWGKPFFMVAVRPSRYTYRFIENAGDFTVNVPPKGMEDIVDYCGNVSGRDCDKFKEKGLSLLPGKRVKSPVISECVLHYECKVAYKTYVVPRKLPQDIISTCYPHGDYHTLYFGEILAIYADEDARKKL